MKSELPSSEKARPLSEQDWPAATPPLLTIRCLTFNHAGFIEAAIQGFLMQETNFPVKIVIHDDASTDGTADIVRSYHDRYPDLITAILQPHNLYSQGLKSAPFVNPHLEGKFIAVCEGDDCWTHPDKLQLQVDYLEQHPEVVMTFHDVEVVDEHSRVTHPSCIAFRNRFPQPRQLRSIRDIFLAHIPSASMVHRNLPIPANPPGIKVPHGDVFRHAMMAHYGEIHQVGEPNQVMARYRVHSGGVWGGNHAIHRNLNHMRSLHGIAAAIDPQFINEACYQLGRSAFRCGLYALKRRDQQAFQQCWRCFLAAWCLAFRAQDKTYGKGINDLIVTWLRLLFVPVAFLLRILFRPLGIKPHCLR